MFVWKEMCQALNKHRLIERKNILSVNWWVSDGILSMADIHSFTPNSEINTKYDIKKEGKKTITRDWEVENCNFLRTGRDLKITDFPQIVMKWSVAATFFLHGEFKKY